MINACSICCESMYHITNQGYPSILLKFDRECGLKHCNLWINTRLSKSNYTEDV